MSNSRYPRASRCIHGYYYALFMDERSDRPRERERERPTDGVTSTSRKGDRRRSGWTESAGGANRISIRATRHRGRSLRCFCGSTRSSRKQTSRDVAARTRRSIFPTARKFRNRGHSLPPSPPPLANLPRMRARFTSASSSFSRSNQRDVSLVS